MYQKGLRTETSAQRPGAVSSGGESMTVTFLRLSAPQNSAMQCVALNQIDPSYMLSSELYCFFHSPLDLKGRAICFASDLLERWGAGVEYHFQEFNEPYAPS